MITGQDWQRLINRIDESLQRDLFETLGCGPFDGGCLACARALKRALGGEVVVLVRANNTADHAAVLLEGQLIDYCGPLDPLDFIARFNSLEGSRCRSWRPFQEGDLPEAEADSDPALEARLADLFALLSETTPA